MARMGLSVSAVLDAAGAIADAEGLDALSLAKLASRLGVKSPSLYNHINGLDTLKEDLTTKAFLMLVDRTRDAMAGIAGKEALAAFGHTQRQFATQHPGLWSAMKLPVARWSQAAQAAADTYLLLALAILRGYGISGDAAIHAVRAVRAALQGFTDLELGGGFNLEQDVDESFLALLDMLDTALRVRGG